MPTSINCNNQTIVQYNLITGGANNTINNVAPGTSGFALTSNGPALQPSFQVFSNSVFMGVNLQVFSIAGNFTYTPTSGMKYCIVEVVGGGGGGGSSTSTSYSTGGGGGAGGYARQIFTASTIGVSQSLTIAAGGAAASTGGSTNFGSLITCTGGSGGQNINSGAPTPGGAGGIASVGGTFKMIGGYGKICIAANGSGVYPGCGGSSFFAPGGTAGTISSKPGSGGIYGSGGGGAGPGSSSPGGVGGAGIIVITEYF